MRPTVGTNLADAAADFTQTRPVKRLILWDIDGTLTFSGGVGSAALKRAIAAVANLTEVPDVDMGGKTDPQILREIFEAAAIDPSHIDALLPPTIAASEAELAAAESELRRNGRLHPGVEDVLRRLDAIDGVRQTLLTGNLTANAAVKVSAFDIADVFDVEVGAYGSDHADRLELVPIALERVERLRGERYALPDEVWVIGDTANDLACARAGGVRCLIVGTGLGFDAVKDLDADVVVPDLSDVDAIVGALTS
jgi:phosphoglycolate phosphatase